MSANWTRRRFNWTFATAACSAPALLADETATPATSSPQTAATPDEPPGSPIVPSVVATEDLLTAALLLRYPFPDLDADRLRAIRAGVARNLHLGDVLRQGLSNSDEPATIFRARRFDR